MTSPPTRSASTAPAPAGNGIAGRALHEAKLALRRTVLARRDALDAAERERRARTIVARLVDQPMWKRARCIVTTASIGSEIETRPLIALAAEAGKRVALPRVNRALRMLELFYVEDFVAQTAAGTWGIAEPVPSLCETADPASIDLAIVPGVAFDRRGGRLGYGGGFYDRLLPTLRPDVPVVAPAFALQIVDEVPRGPRDIAIDSVVTEDELIACDRSPFAIDHVVANARTALDDARAAWQRLGFAVTPLGRHTLGSINHLVVLDDAYVELLGLPPGQAPPARPELVARPAGWFACALRAADADAARRALAVRGIDAGAVQSFSRPVEYTEQGEARHGEASFRVLRPPPVDGAWPPLFYCEHRTPAMVWRDEWRDHPNGAQCLLAVTIRSEERDATARWCERLAGAKARVDGELRVLELRGMRLEIVQRRAEQAAETEATRGAAIDGAPLVDVRTDSARNDGVRIDSAQYDGVRIESVRFGVRDLDACARLLAARRIRAERRGGEIRVDAAETMGASVAFVALDARD